MTKHYNQYHLAVKELINDVGKKIVIAIPLGVGKPIGLINALYQLAEEDPSIHLTILTGLTLARPTLTNELEKRFVEPILDRLLKDYEDLLYEKARVNQRLPKNIEVIEFFLSPGKYLHNAYVQQNYISCNYSTAGRDIINQEINVIAQLVSVKDSNYSLSCNTDLFHEMVAYLKQSGKKFAILGEVNNHLPFMFGKAAILQENEFTHLIDTKKYKTLFPIPRERLTLQDHAIGFYASSLIKDGGCLQIGIGKLSNAVANALIFGEKNASTRRFNEGLYAITEMFSDEYFELYKANILKKKFAGKVAHVGFILGSTDLYRELKALPDEERKLIEMVPIAETNTLVGNYERTNARFINSAMMVTLGGAVISDGLNDLQEVSGVGGQFDFVQMANQLPGARSLILCRATRETKQGIKSNIIWDYGNCTVPRCFRDIIITEYGIADCRSKTDADVIKALLNIADSRFQNGLLNKAKKYGKVEKTYQVPKEHRHNFPNKLQAIADLNLPAYPFGGDFTETEQVLEPVLMVLKNYSNLRLLGLIALSLLDFRSDAVVKPYLQRLGLLNPKSIKEWIYKKILKKLLLEQERIKTK